VFQNHQFIRLNIVFVLLFILFIVIVSFLGGNITNSLSVHLLKGRLTDQAIVSSTAAPACIYKYISDNIYKKAKKKFKMDNKEPFTNINFKWGNHNPSDLNNKI